MTDRGRRLGAGWPGLNDFLRERNCEWPARKNVYEDNPECVDQSINEGQERGQQKTHSQMNTPRGGEQFKYVQGFRHEHTARVI